MYYIIGNICLSPVNVGIFLLFIVSWSVRYCWNLLKLFLMEDLHKWSNQIRMVYKKFFSLLDIKSTSLAFQKGQILIIHDNRRHRGNHNWNPHSITSGRLGRFKIIDTNEIECWCLEFQSRSYSLSNTNFRFLQL